MSLHRISGSHALRVFVTGLVAASLAVAAPPVVKTVPWVPSNPLIPHDTWSGKTITLKGTSSIAAGVTYTWDFGDGSPVATGAVGDPYAVQATHAYAGPVGTVYTARLTLSNADGSASKEYYVAIRAQALPIEVNVAIDEGLWYLHRTMYRYPSGGVDYGYWNGGNVGSSYPANSAANLNAFEVNGHLETGSATNPYTETVQRGMRQLFAWITVSSMPNSQTNPKGTFNPDANGNGYMAYLSAGSDTFYETGPFMDAVVASGTPAAVASTGTAPSGGNPGVLGRTYKSIVQDMVDAHAYCQYDSNPNGGGWYYYCNNIGDNSISQWAAIGLIAAERNWGATFSPLVKTWNVDWLNYASNMGATTNYLGYQGSAPAWGPYATTPSGMVQMAMDGVGRGNPLWDKTENYMRQNFCNPVVWGATSAPRAYYYGLFSFVKSMLLHDSNGDTVAEPITLLRDYTGTKAPIDWYSAQASEGAECDGVARTLVSQQTSGYWYGHNYYGTQFTFETAWAIMMLSRTLFESGGPVAVASANPNPSVAGATVTLDGGTSYHQDASKHIDSWLWKICKVPGHVGVDTCAVVETKGGVSVTSTFAALGNYQVRLTVTDDATPEKTAETILTVLVSQPPLAPTADAGGPYNFCVGRTPWFLDASASTNPDEGQKQIGCAGCPGDTIVEYAWDLDGNGTFVDATGMLPDVTGYFSSLIGSSRLITLRVKDRTSLAFPSSGSPDLTDTDTAIVNVKAATDPSCSCVSNLVARPKSGKVQLTWTYRVGAHHYNIYRGTVSGGPYLKIGQSTLATFLDSPVVNATTYYYVIREALVDGSEVCQSNQTSAKPTTI